VLSHASPGAVAEEHFLHQAYLYEGEGGFLAGTVPFVEAGLTTGEAVLVVVSAAKIAAMRDLLGPQGNDVQFADMAEVGQNPARIIPFWQDFVEANTSTGRGVRGIGEPVFPERTPAQLTECHLHEALLNVAFDSGPAWPLLCPYDLSALDPEIVAEAHRTHPHVATGDGLAASADYHAIDGHPFGGELPLPPPSATRIEFSDGPLGTIRQLIASWAAGSGLSAKRIEDLVLATCEVVTNSIRHGGGGGVLQLWDDEHELMCDVTDQGTTAAWDPLVGRVRPGPGQVNGRGLWMVNQLCDLVQVRSTGSGSAVRLHVRLG
jgi:anti-sigma regulatory factor (Ser/Thr protein kinase)